MIVRDDAGVTVCEECNGQEHIFDLLLSHFAAILPCAFLHGCNDRRQLFGIDHFQKRVFLRVARLKQKTEQLRLLHGEAYIIQADSKNRVLPLRDVHQVFRVHLIDPCESSSLQSIDRLKMIHDWLRGAVQLLRDRSRVYVFEAVPADDIDSGVDDHITCNFRFRGHRSSSLYYNMRYVTTIIIQQLYSRVNRISMLFAKRVNDSAGRMNKMNVWEECRGN